MPNQPKPVKKIPSRRCTGCGEHFPKGELIRVVRAPDGAISIDGTGKAPGRGAYLCKKTACLTKARKAHRLEAAFSCQIDAGVWDELEARLREYAEN